ncbi:hypothetical protein [Pelosinus sp. UFO1]|uniref:hypothetical protein n=1 Tax=Pelosinus sp. UFO1 TaxID=484770 RepID=UPI0004D185E3|nr:hypothetical protein [Pelosinus sp. UFO1]AIF53723.1 hypothetical protein UFO1_4180 [Pelosinus sp. UFO1]
MLQKDMKNICIIIIIYTITHGLMLFNHGLYWDDWPWYKMDTQLRFDAISQLGAPWLAYFQSYLFSFDNMLIVRYIVFFSFLLAALFLYIILKTIKEIDPQQRLLIVIFFAIFPCNSLRIAMCVSQYAVAYCLFFCGLWILSRYLKTRKLSLRILSLLLFFISFTTNSFLVFYALAILYIIYIEKPDIINYKICLKLSYKYLDFLLNPLVFYIIKIYVFPAHGLYAGYNSIIISRVLTSPIKAINVFYHSVIRIIDKAINIYISSPTTIILLTLSILLVYGILSKRSNSKYILCKKPLVFGFFCFYLAAFPYLAVGNPIDWNFLDSRNQLLLPLGISIIIVYGVQWLTNHNPLINYKSKIKSIIYSVLIILCISINIATYISFQKDWYKQVSLIDNIKNNNIIINNTTFLFKDNLVQLNAFSREYWLYEYTGFFKEAFGDEKRFGSNFEAYYAGDVVARGEHRHRPLYLLGDYQTEPPQYLINIEEGNFKLSTRNMFQLMYYEMLDSPKYYNTIKDILVLRVQKL